MAIDRGRRAFVGSLGSAPLLWPLAARAQQPAIPVVGILGSGSPQSDAFRVAAVRQGLAEAGYVEGRNVAFEYRWAEEHYERLPELAAELVRRQVAVMISIGGINAAVAAKSSTATIPIVFAAGSDPIKLGLVASLNHPGGNVTGVNFLTETLVAKQFEVLHETVPKTALIGVLVNPHVTIGVGETKNALAAAEFLGRRPWCCKPAPTASWTPPLSPWINSMQARSWSPAMRSFSAAGTDWLNLRHVKICQRSTISANTQPPAAS